MKYQNECSHMLLTGAPLRESVIRSTKHRTHHPPGSLDNKAERRMTALLQRKVRSQGVLNGLDSSFPTLSRVKAMEREAGLPERLPAWGKNFNRPPQPDGEFRTTLSFRSMLPTRASLPVPARYRSLSTGPLRVESPLLSEKMIPGGRTVRTTARAVPAFAKAVDRGERPRGYRQGSIIQVASRNCSRGSCQRVERDRPERTGKEGDHVLP